MIVRAGKASPKSVGLAIRRGRLELTGTSQGCWAYVEFLLLGSLSSALKPFQLMEA